MKINLSRLTFVGYSAVTRICDMRNALRITSTRDHDIVWVINEEWTIFVSVSLSQEHYSPNWWLRSWIPKSMYIHLYLCSYYNECVHTLLIFEFFSPTSTYCNGWKRRVNALGRNISKTLSALWLGDRSWQHEKKKNISAVRIWRGRWACPIAEACIS